MLFITVVWVGCSSRDPLTPEERAWLVQHDGKIVVNNETGWPPIIDTDNDGNPVGIVPDFQRLIEKKLNFKFKLDRLDTWENFMERFRKGEIDVNNNLQNNPKRTEFALFTKPYIGIPNAIIVRKEIKGELTLAKMQGMKIAVTRDFAIHDFLKANYGYLNALPLENDLHCLLETSTRSVDAAIVNLAVASFLIEKKGIANLRIAGYAEYANDLCFASRKDWPILNRILDKGLDLITRSERDAIYRKWISLEPPPFYKKGIFWVVTGSAGAVLLGLILLILVWNRSLKRQVQWRTENLEQTNLQLKKEIEERRKTEESLRQSEEDYQQLFEAESDAIFLIDNETGTILQANLAACLMYGYNREELLAMKSTDLSVEAEQTRKVTQETPPLIDQVFTIPLCWHRKKDGSRFPVEITGRFFLRAGCPVHIAAIRDITERRRAEEEREKLQNQLGHSQKMESVGRLAGGVAHDFNNMLGVILGHAELVMEQVGGESPLKDDLVEIRKAALRSADLTRQLLAFARRQTAVLRVIDLNETITGMLKMLRRLIGEDIELVWSPGKDLWPVKVDPAQVDQILVNLFVNARDAIDGVGRVTIETENVTLVETVGVDMTPVHPGDYIRLSVSDDGSGMDPETLPNIFDPFFTTKEVGRGTGLGLATVYGIVKQNEGFIHVTSEPGQGTSFAIHLPRSVEAAETKEKGDVQAIARGTETVLLVEDEESILNLTQSVLERLGYTVLAARTPGEALSAAQRHRGAIDLLITDVVMPEMNGRGLGEEIAKLQPNIKILFMSGYTSDEVLRRGILDGGVHFLQKPFSVSWLAGKLREILDEK